MQPVLLALFFIAMAAVSVSLMVTLVVPEVAELFSGPGNDAVSIWRVLTILVIAVTLVFAALYAAGLLWLFIACHLFRRGDVEQLLKAGPNTRLEIWIFERYSR